MKQSSSGLLLVNLASLFISSSGVLGRLIELPSLVTSFFRCAFSIVFISLIIVLIKGRLHIDWRRNKKEFVWSGFFLAAHWGTYFYALQISNVSIAIIALFTYPIITTLIEPIFYNIRLEKINVFTSCLVLIGVIILVPEFNLTNDYTLGLLVGLLSALLYALRNLVSKKLVNQYPGDHTLVVQLVIAGAVLSPSLIYYSFELSWTTLGLLLILSLFTTSLGHTLFLMALKHLTTSSASILASLQPVYAILLAVVLINEELRFDVVVGGLLILSALIIQNLWPNFKKTH